MVYRVILTELAETSLIYIEMCCPTAVPRLHDSCVLTLHWANRTVYKYADVPAELSSSTLTKQSTCLAAAKEEKLRERQSLGPAGPDFSSQLDVSIVF